jgi:oxygen-independent coproporphyrinogen-3 oxidase
MTNRAERPRSIYLHIPFCTTKCTYCAFNTYINLEHIIAPFVDALSQEIEIVAQGHDSTQGQVHTVFFGGGTPTLLTAEQFGQILAVIRREFDVLPDAEITSEANPNDLDYAYLMGLRAVGINRLSIGMQSANPDELKLFARRHDHEVVTRIMPEVRRAGFDNVNLDLMYGTPYQTLDSWRHTLEATIGFDPEHVSLYALGLEDGTPLKEWVESGRVATPDDDLAADMYDLATTLLAEAGYAQYEISNWAKPGYECRHNLQYWRNDDYIGVGPGAHGWAGGVRYATLLGPLQYIRAMQAHDGTAYAYPRTPATVDEVQVERADEIAETLIMWLRLTREGVDRALFRQRFGIDLVDYHAEVMQRFSTRGLLEITPERVRLTAQGRLLSNMVFRELV